MTLITFKFFFISSTFKGIARYWINFSVCLIADDPIFKKLFSAGDHQRPPAATYIPVYFVNKCTNIQMFKHVFIHENHTYHLVVRHWENDIIGIWNKNGRRCPTISSFVSDLRILPPSNSHFSIPKFLKFSVRITEQHSENSLRVVQIQALIFFKLMSERVGSDTQRLWTSSSIDFESI